jgi:hypothetical protein
VAASEVKRQASPATTARPRAAMWADRERRFFARCARPAVHCGDIDVETEAAFTSPEADRRTTYLTPPDQSCAVSAMLLG